MLGDYFLNPSDDGIAVFRRRLYHLERLFKRVALDEEEDCDVGFSLKHIFSLFLAKRSRAYLLLLSHSKTPVSFSSPMIFNSSFLLYRSLVPCVLFPSASMSSTFFMSSGSLYFRSLMQPRIQARKALRWMSFLKFWPCRFCGRCFLPYLSYGSDVRGYFDTAPFKTRQDYSYS